MSKVKFFELSKTTRLRRIEGQINRELAATIPSRPSVTLFETAEGEVGYSVSGVPLEGGRAIMGKVHRTIRKTLKLRRGRPVSEPKHQVKFWIPETKYRALTARARRESVSPSRLAGTLVADGLP
ncbi:MAG: hypothetical protein HY077_10030 [Elusimicrobia bacterium]|nr:hypothetical protein [Elusimicrobiota bacterium]